VSLRLISCSFMVRFLCPHKKVPYQALTSVSDQNDTIVYLSRFRRWKGLVA
jgi:hypothetical protein